MSMQREKALKKIKQCLALSKSSNSNEAGVALRQAHKLMKKYDINGDEVELSEVIFNSSDSKLPKKLSDYHWMLANMIAEVFGCEVYHNLDNEKNPMVFVGLGIHSKVAGYAFDTLFVQLKQARLEYLKNTLNRVRIRKNKTDRADMFCMGWVRKVRDLASNLAPQDTNRDLLKRAIENNVGSLDVAKIKRVGISKAVTLNDFGNGLSKGEEAKLFQGVGGESEDELSTQYYLN